MYIFAQTAEETYKQTYSVNGWCEWQKPVITGIDVTDGNIVIGVYFKGAAVAWGTYDDFYLGLED